MLATNIEQPSYTGINDQSPPGMSYRAAGQHRTNTERPCSCCGRLMWRIIDCFRSSTQPEQVHARPVIVVDTHVGQYQAPVVSPPPRANSVSSCEDDQDREHGTLLPKRHAPELSRLNAASTSSAAAAGAATAAGRPDEAVLDLPRHRRTGSGKVRVMATASATATITSAKTSKYSALSHQEYASVLGLLGADADDEDFCPTCLEAYTDDNPKIFTRCGHAFHMQCIYAWLERKNTCPLCESPMDLQDDILL